MAASRHVLVIASLLQHARHGSAHSLDSYQEAGSDMGSMSNTSSSALLDVNDVWYQPSYSGLKGHFNLMLVHITLMVVAWLLLLPIGVMLSIARARIALPTQLLFLSVNGGGMIFGVLYNAKTPDLYANNAHHRIGWLATWLVVAQVTIGLLSALSGRSKKEVAAMPAETASFLPMSVEAMAQHQQFHDPQRYKDIRQSGDSGQGTERASSSLLRSRDPSPTHTTYLRQDYERCLELEAEKEEDDDDRHHVPPSRNLLHSIFVHRPLKRRLPAFDVQRALKVFERICDGINRIVLILGFIAFLTGGVTYAGIFRGKNVFNGLAHFIKGGIFFWYGLWTLGRWMGCFADLGWAWNVKPGKWETGSWKASMPTTEFIESLLICLYGITNVFLEHLAAWGGPWTAQDLEHVSISLMFFGGGLCGMLIESQRIRDWLNTSVELLAQNHLHLDDARYPKSQPRSSTLSMNPMPALIILVLGLVLASHHQSSMVSIMIHKQCGSVLAGCALARAVTYLLFFLSPPTSHFPSRPPSEIVSAFCLISGGLLLMAGNKDLTHIMEEHDLAAMVIFTVCVGLTAFLMAYEILVLAIKGWATRRATASPKGLSPAMRYGP